MDIVLVFPGGNGGTAEFCVNKVFCFWGLVEGEEFEVIGVIFIFGAGDEDVGVGGVGTFDGEGVCAGV